MPLHRRLSKREAGKYFISLPDMIPFRVQKITTTAGNPGYEIVVYDEDLPEAEREVIIHSVD